MDVIDRIVSDESLIRRNWLTTEEAADEVVSFEERFGEPHLWLACHAALPVVLTPELVNLIRINFLDKAGVPWIAEQDFLLSPLCRPVGNELFETEPRVREVLLYELENGSGPNRPHELAEFLLDYTESPIGAQQRAEINQLQRWVALAYVAPERLVEEMTQHLLSSISGGGAPRLSSHVKIATAYEFVADALERSLPPEEYRQLTNDSRLMAYYWYGDRKELRSSLAEAAASGSPAATAGVRPETLTVFLDWVRSAPVEAASPFAEEVPLAEQPPEDWDESERSRFDAALARLGDDAGFGTAAYRVIVVAGAPGPARMEFVRRIADARRSGFGAQLYLDLRGGVEGQTPLGARDIQTVVLKRLSPGVEPPPDEEALRAAYERVLSEHPTLLVLDNVEAAQVEALVPAPESLLVVTTARPEVAASGSIYVFDMDAPPISPGELTREEISYLSQLLAYVFMNSSLRPAEAALAFLPSEILQRIPDFKAPDDYAEGVVQYLVSVFPAYLPNLLDFLLVAAIDEEISARLQSIKARLGPPAPYAPLTEDSPLPSPPGMLPLFGRRKELQTILQTFVTRPRSLVIIEGPAGIGKTALATMVVNTPELGGMFQTVIRLSLKHPGDDRRGVMVRLAHAIGLDVTRYDNEAVYQMLRRELGQMRHLIVMDETFYEADVETIDSLAPAAIIYTTREVPHRLLAKNYSLHIHLGPLTLDDSVELLRGLLPAYADAPILEQLAREASGDPRRLTELARMLNGLPPSEELGEALKSLPDPQAADAGPEAETVVEDPQSLPPPARAEVLVLYSHQDERWADRLRDTLRPLMRGSLITFLNDVRLTTFTGWREKLETVLAGPTAVVILVSADFLASHFMTGDLLKRLVDEGAVQRAVIPVILSPSRVEDTFLSKYQSINSPSKPLIALTRARRDEVFANVSRVIANVLERVKQEPGGSADVERVPLDLSEVNIPILIGDVLRQLRGEHEAAEWHVNFPGGFASTVSGDRLLLFRLFYELMDNARLAVSGRATPDPQVSITGRIDGDKLRVEISDNGPGLPDGMLDDLFQLGASSTRRRVGVGLYTANKIALRHGGKIELLRTSSGGTTIVVELPAAVRETDLVEGRPRQGEEEARPEAPAQVRRSVPYWFYFSYARSDAESDKYLEWFYRDLAQEVARIAGVSPDADEIGYFDRTAIEPGDVWEQTAAEALRSCRSLVCLYSRRYFASDFCGKEFEVFRRRLDNYWAVEGLPRPPLIQPVLWDSPKRIERLLPPAAAEIQYLDPAFGEMYAREGLYFLIMLQGYRDEYRKFTYTLAKQIVQMVETYPLQPLPQLPAFEEIPSAFHTGAADSADQPGPSKGT